MTKPKRKRKQDDSDNTTSSQSSIERIMIKPVYTNLNDEEKKGITELGEEEKKCLNAGKPRLFEVDKKKKMSFSFLLL